jgi:hypothetical protein
VATATAVAELELLLEETVFIFQVFAGALALCEQRMHFEEEPL